MMGFWNIKAAELRLGDEIRVRTMGGEEYLEVLRLEKEDGEIRAQLEWGAHIPNGDPFWDTLTSDQQLTVRR